MLKAIRFNDDSEYASPGTKSSVGIVDLHWRCRPPSGGTVFLNRCDYLDPALA